ncbi:MAG: hypothetical protein ACRDTD_25150 [Pseudonocardiaceae bacterium]
MGAARVRGLTYFLPSLAIAEVQVLRPDTGGLLDDLADHPHVIVGRLNSTDAAAVEQALKATNTFDVLAGWVVHACRQRGWPALTTDPARLRRLDPTVPIDLL